MLVLLCYSSCQFSSRRIVPYFHHLQLLSMSLCGPNSAAVIRCYVVPSVYIQHEISSFNGKCGAFAAGRFQCSLFLKENCHHVLGGEGSQLGPNRKAAYLRAVVQAIIRPIRLLEHQSFLFINQIHLKTLSSVQTPNSTH
ncbi:hypothetical protein R1flu_005669 [Riccia fluitans]|uniref:Uncharacterized protein n=1 Tax=Riccia fluitans TaxID=41844 RepID=A0ABD1YTU0_9MARC